LYPMLRKITAYFFACLFLTGSAFLPLCDFSLMNDIPNMYQSYQKLATPEENGIVDFIGDYLFAGKTLLGHNKNDKPESSALSVQFQHSPTVSSFFYYDLKLPHLFVKDFKILHTPLKNPTEVTAFYSELFRPPLA
jgi:hypothetical protein